MNFIKISVLSLLVLGCGFDVDDPILQPPSDLTYNPNNVILNVTETFVSSEPIINGVPPFLYKLDNAADLGSFISLDSLIGVISVDGNLSEVGNYSLDIDVLNTDGKTLFTEVYTITIE